MVNFKVLGFPDAYQVLTFAPNKWVYVDVEFVNYVTTFNLSKITTTDDKTMTNVDVVTNLACLPPILWKVVTFASGQKFVLVNSSWRKGDKGLAASCWAPKVMECDEDEDCGH